MKRILCLTLMLALVLSAVLAPTAALAASRIMLRPNSSSIPPGERLVLRSVT